MPVTTRVYQQRALIVAGVLSALAGWARAGNDAQVVSSSIPASMWPGWSYGVSVTMGNTGDTTWRTTEPQPYALGAVGDSDPFAATRHSVGGDIPPGQQKTFNFTMTAPIAENTYTTDWRMVQEHVQWFGETLTSNVQVVFGPDPPPAPNVTYPPANSWIPSNRPDITWDPVSHDKYHVRVGATADPNMGPWVWDSGEVAVSRLTTSVTTPPLPVEQWHYLFVRLHNSHGWGPWSAGKRFYVIGEFLNDPVYIGEPAGGQWPHSICYDPDDHEYLLAFADALAGQQSRISYYLLDETGSKKTGKFTITDDDHLDGVHEPAVAYSSAAREYLITYSGWMDDYTSELHDQLRAQRVRVQTGAKEQGSYALYDCEDLDAMSSLKMVYAPTRNVYLVAWGDSWADGEIVAMALDGATGLPAAGENMVTLTLGEPRLAVNPSIAWNLADGEFMVIFQIDASCDPAACETDPECDCHTSPWCIQHGCTDNGWDYYGQRLRYDPGTGLNLLGSNIELVTTPAWDFNGDVAYDPDLHRYLMVYESHYSGAAIWGQFLAAGGQPSGASFPVLSSPWSGGAVNLGWHPNTREYLAAWLDCCTAGDYARRISQMGAPIGEPFKLTGAVEGIGNWKPLPTPNANVNEFLFSWFCSYNDVYTRRYRTYPNLDVTPPAAVTQFATTPGRGQITLSWTNPTTSDFLATVIRYRNDQFPVDEHDGTALVVKVNAPGSVDSYAHAGVDWTKRYYYAAFAVDAVPNYATAVTRSERALVPVDFDADGDVDQEDFGHLQACLSGDGTNYPSGCQDADVDADGDVDANDLVTFEGCMAGPGQPPGC